MYLPSFHSKLVCYFFFLWNKKKSLLKILFRMTYNEYQNNYIFIFWVNCRFRSIGLLHLSVMLCNLQHIRCSGRCELQETSLKNLSPKDRLYNHTRKQQCCSVADFSSIKMRSGSSSVHTVTCIFSQRYSTHIHRVSKKSAVFFLRKWNQVVAGRLFLFLLCCHTLIFLKQLF